MRVRRSKCAALLLLLVVVVVVVLLLILSIKSKKLITPKCVHACRKIAYAR